MSGIERRKLAVVSLMVLPVLAVGCVPGATDPDLTICAAPGGVDDGVAATYYVATNAAGATDGNDGLSQTYEGGTRGPWRTIAHAAASMRAGDTTIVLAGTYAEAMIQFCYSGTANAPIVLSGAGPANVIIEGGGAQAGIVIGPGVGHITLEGLTVRNVSVHGIVAGAENDTTVAPNIILRNLHVSNYGTGAADYGVGILMYNVDAFSLDNLETSDGAFNGVQLVGCTNGTVTNSTFYGNPAHNANGIEIQQGHHITVIGCVAYDNAGYGFDISLWPKQPPYAHDMTIEECFAYNNGNSGFAANSRSYDLVFRRNIAWNNGIDPVGQWGGFVCYDGTTNVTFEHNVSIDNDGPGFIISNSSWAQVIAAGPLPGNTFTFYNNITHANSEGALMVEGTNEWTIVSDHNNWNALASGLYTVSVMQQQYTPAQINAGAFGVNDICSDPLFVGANAAPPDVHLQSGSPCINTGRDLGRSFQGNAPDMGRYETATP